MHAQLSLNWPSQAHDNAFFSAHALAASFAIALSKSCIFYATRAGYALFPSRKYVLFPCILASDPRGKGAFESFFQGMKTSSYLEQTLSFRQNPAIDQYFEARASHLFERQGGSSCIEIHLQRPIRDQSTDQWNIVQKSDPKQDFDGDCEPSSHVDWDHDSRENPPHYDGWPGLEQQKVSNAEVLEKIANVRKPMVVIGIQTEKVLNNRRQRNAFACGMYIRSL